MKFYCLDTSGDFGEKYCYTKNSLKGFGKYVYYFGDGRAIKPYIQEGKFELSLTQDHLGIKKGAIIGNRASVLLCRNDFKCFLEDYMKDYELEIFPFILMRSKKKIHSDEYFALNPVGTFDCMNYDESEIDYMYDESEGKEVVIGIDKYVLDKKKLENAPPLFRLKEEPQIYVVNEIIAKEIEQQGFDNIDLIEFDIM